MSYLNMNGRQASGGQNFNLEEGSIELPRPPVSTYQRILDVGLQPQHVYSVDDVIEHAILLNQHLQRDRQNLNHAMCSLIICLWFIL